MTGTNEISGIYVGLATNQANVSQAELVGTWKMTGATNCVFSTTSPTYGSPSNYSTPDSDCNNPTVTGDIVSKGKVLGFDINMKPGKYVIQAQAPFVRSGSTVSGVAFRVTDGTTTSNNQLIYAASGFELFGLNTITFSTEYTTASTKTIYLDGISDTVSVSATIQNNGGREVQFLVYRFPTSSELVVTPERQNTWGGVQYRNATNTLLFNAVAAPTAYSAFNAAGWNQPTMLKGKAAVTTTGSGNDLGLSIPNMPVGSYQLNVSGFLMANTGNSGIGSTRVRCSFRVRETTTSSVIAQSTAQNWVINTASGLSDSRDYPHAFHGVYNNTAVATRNFILEASKITDNVGGNLGQCEVVTTGFDMDLTITIEPLDQPSNSALYVQGPVLGAQTGAAIPAGYQGEVASVTDTSIRTQVSPTTSGTWYTPWAGTLTLTTGNWNVCYRVVAEINQSLATNYSRIETRLYNVTDSAEQFTLVTLPSTGSNLNDLGNTHFGCKAISITSIKTYRVDIRHVGSATSVTLYFRNDISSGEIYATRLN
jgi:hypothetical protein